MAPKVFGYSLLLSGIGIIIYAFINVFLIVLGNIEPFNLLDLEAISIDASQIAGSTAAGNSTIELLSSQSLNKTVNLISHLFLMGFVVNVGYRLAKIGSNLVRPIYIKVQGKEFQKYPPFEVGPKEKE